MLVYLPHNMKSIGSKWVYKVKLKEGGLIEIYKAILVYKGYNQVERLDFFDTFSLVAKLISFRLLFALAYIKQ